MKEWKKKWIWHQKAESPSVTTMTSQSPSGSLSLSPWLMNLDGFQGLAEDWGREVSGVEEAIGELRWLHKCFLLSFSCLQFLSHLCHTSAWDIWVEGGEWFHGAQVGGEYLSGLCSVRWIHANGKNGHRKWLTLSFPIGNNTPPSHTLLVKVKTSRHGRTIRYHMLRTLTLFPPFDTVIPFLGFIWEEWFLKMGMGAPTMCKDVHCSCGYYRGWGTILWNVSPVRGH